MYKRAKLHDDGSDATVASSKEKTIGTHSGTFQADEAMGVWMLRQLPTYRYAKITRSRDPETLKTCHIVLDVGSIYDHETLKYDHHQRGYDERFDEGRDDGKQGGRCTKLSASGLIYRHYGREVLKTYYPELEGKDLSWVYVRLYDTLLEALDAVDTGVEPSPGNVQLLYKDRTDLSSRVSRLNPRWNEFLDDGVTKPNPDDRFQLAMDACGQDFVSVMTQIVESQLPARSYVEQALLNREETDPSKQIIVFKSGGMPWRDHLYDLEKQYKINDPSQQILFVLYQDESGMWRVQCVTIEGLGFQNRLSLPSPWRGLRDQELKNVSKIDGVRFVHAAGFIGGNDTYEGALEMAKIAMTFVE